MKKTIAFTAFALVMSLPLASSALTVTNSFVGSSSGTETLAVGDTIQFEVTLDTDPVIIDTLLFTLTGDVTGALGSSLGSGWTGVAHNVTSWSWNYKFGKGETVNFGTNGLIPPVNAPQPIPAPALQSFGFFGVGGKTGGGGPAIVGTVTITTNASGVFQGGAAQYPGVDGSFPTPGLGTISGGAFTVVPEPGTALLMLLGLGGLGVAGRRRNR